MSLRPVIHDAPKIVEENIKKNINFVKEFNNESEFNRWFKKNYNLFGFESIIKNGSQRFPDFVMMMNKEPVRVELETFSSNFLVHKHDPSKVDLIICLIKDTILEKPVVEINSFKYIRHTNLCTNPSCSNPSYKFYSLSTHLVNKAHDTLNKKGIDISCRQVRYEFEKGFLTAPFCLECKRTFKHSTYGNNYEHIIKEYFKGSKNVANDKLMLVFDLIFKLNILYKINMDNIFTNFPNYKKEYKDRSIYLSKMINFKEDCIKKYFINFPDNDMEDAVDFFSSIGNLLDISFILEKIEKNKKEKLSNKTNIGYYYNFIKNIINFVKRRFTKKIE